MVYKRKTSKGDYNPFTWSEAPDLLTISQAARLVGCHINTLDGWMNSDKISFTRLNSGHRRIYKTDLAQYLGITLDSEGGILSDDGRLLAAYLTRFDRAVDKMRKHYAAHKAALEEITSLVGEMREKFNIEDKS